MIGSNSPISLAESSWRLELSCFHGKSCFAGGILQEARVFFQIPAKGWFMSWQTNGLSGEV